MGLNYFILYFIVLVFPGSHSRRNETIDFLFENWMKFGRPTMLVPCATCESKAVGPCGLFAIRFRLVLAVDGLGRDI